MDFFETRIKNPDFDIPNSGGDMVGWQFEEAGELYRFIMELVKTNVDFEVKPSDGKIGERKFIRKEFINRFKAIRKRDWQDKNLVVTSRNPFKLPEKEKKKIAGRSGN